MTLHPVTGEHTCQDMFYHYTVMQLVLHYRFKACILINNTSCTSFLHNVSLTLTVSLKLNFTFLFFYHCCKYINSCTIIV